VGATSVGRSLAPRVAARFRTGLTADCTQLEMKPETDLVQIRPAFGGNIMARILTTHTRPQFATVRYKVMEPAACVDCPAGEVIRGEIGPGRLESRIKVVEVVAKEKRENISDAEVLVVAGRGVKKAADLTLLEELAGLLGGEIACTRPLVEAGWFSYTRQIGLSGRTVKPKLIITCGVSGAVQFTACMNGSERIFAINQDRTASIFKVAHYGIVGDLYQILPRLITTIREGGASHAL
jgi:electron transfer flavoprotein alpha subunit